MKVAVRFSILLCLLSAVVFPSSLPAADLVLNGAHSQVFFSPRGGCTEAIVRQIDGARSELLVQAYSFTSREIAAALLRAHKRGVRVRIILDKSNRSAKYSSADFAAHAGIPTFIDARHAIAHNKIMILDRETVITGSFNFTRAAEESNAENVLVIRSRDLAGLYRDNWEAHRAHSEPYRGK
ncbi:MAG: Phospholipase D precursor [Syntrophaceae bacterium PtaU1.Bin231]|nr:MAG: Phospholipase D precursor [Syntrophaceae bacterium PtaU1.Bin231]HOG17877.1 phospholipase D family protein [Syntrophales bacterium]